MLTKEDIFNADDMQYETREVPEWGGAVRIATMSGTYRDQYEQALATSMKNGATASNLRALFLAYCMVDAKGDLLMSPAEVARLGQKNGAVLDRLFNAASDLNRTSTDSLEETAKN